jgi:hypothetical protein
MQGAFPVRDDFRSLSSRGCSFWLSGFQYYDPETGKPNTTGCPRSSKICWFIHPNEPEWTGKGGVGGGGSFGGSGGGRKISTSTSPRYSGGRGRSSSPSRGKGRGRSSSQSRGRGRGRSRSTDRRRTRSRSSSSGRPVSPNRRRAIYSSPPRRLLRDRSQRSRSPRPPTSPRPRRHSPAPRRPRHDRRPRTPTPISSSRGHTPPRLDHSAVKLEPSTETLPSTSPNPVRPALGDTSTSAVGKRTPVQPRGSVDRHRHQPPPPLDLSLGERATATSTPPQPFTPRVAPLSPVFCPETPIIPGLASSVSFTQPQITAISALQKSLELVIKDQTTGQPMKPPPTPPVGNSSASRPVTVPDMDKTEVWTARVKCVNSLVS